MLVALGGDIATLAVSLLAPRLRAWRARRHPEQAAVRERTHQARRLADTCGCVAVRAEQQGPALIRLRGLHRDPLLASAQIDLPGLDREAADVVARLIRGGGGGVSEASVNKPLASSRDGEGEQEGERMAWLVGTGVGGGT